MAADLDEALLEVCRQHNLKRCDVGVSPREGSYRCHATVHWSGFARGGNACAIGHGETLAVALADALSQAAAERLPDAAIELPTLAAAA